MPTQSNATLIQIRDDAIAADWRSSPAADGPEKWHGRARAYYTEKRERVTINNETDIVVRRTLIVDNELGKMIDNGDVLVFDYMGSTQSARARLSAQCELSGISPDLRTTRIELDDA